MSDAAFHLLSVVGSLFLDRSFPLAFLADLIPLPLTTFSGSGLLVFSLLHTSRGGLAGALVSVFLLSAFSRATLVRAQKLDHPSWSVPLGYRDTKRQVKAWVDGKSFNALPNEFLQFLSECRPPRQDGHEETDAS